MDTVVGKKNNKDLYNNLISEHIPATIELYVEPFGGTFSLINFFRDRVKKSVYNDFKTYDFDVNADIVHHEDFENIIKRYDSTETFFYIDPPYYNKENYYGLKKSDKEFHTRLFNVVENIKGNFIISYDEDSFILNLYKKYNIYNYKGVNPFRKKEIIITR